MFNILNNLLNKIPVSIVITLLLTQKPKIMKKIFYSISLLASAFLVSTQASAQAELQVIHNAPDPAAATVDIYVNGNNAIDDFAFRSATPFIPLPSGVPLEIGIAPGNSTSVNDTLKNFSITLMAGEKYIAIARGVLNPASFAVNPDGISTAFDLTFITNAQSAAAIPSNVDLLVYHGATDAPAVDVIARNVATLVNDASYTDATAYFPVPPGNYLLDVTPAANNSLIVATYQADLTGLTGGAAVIFASGFLDPAANQNGAAFGLFAALPAGIVVALPQTSVARLQVIHNAADPAAASVDVYLNGALALDNFAFRTATPFIDVAADITVNIGIAPSTSVSVNDTLVNFPMQFTNNETYVAIANGVLNPSNFAVNPDGVSTGFTLLMQQNIRESAINAGDVDFIAVHGASDAPSVDIIARNVATLVDDATYTDITPYITVPPASYLLDVTPASANNTILASFTADLSGLAGSSAVVFASGFLIPALNQGGESFGLFAALPNGTVVAFPAASQARLQVIHNAADPAAAVVDVYVNGTLVVPAFAFRTATPFIDIPGDVNLNIGIAPGGSTSVNDTIANFQVQLINGQTYIAVANGVLNPATFAPNPDGLSTAFNLWVQQDIRENSLLPGEVDFIAVHGATDAPTVDIQLNGVGSILVNDAAYGDITGYLNVAPAAYTLDVTPGSNNSIILATYLADLSTLADQTAVIFASGFLNPATNQNGAGFALWATLTDGTTFPLPVVTGINDNNEQYNVGIYPNPVAANSIVTISNVELQSALVEILDTNGKVVKSVNIPAGKSGYEISTQGIAGGVYVIKTVSGVKTGVAKLIIQ